MCICSQAPCVRTVSLVDSDTLESSLILTTAHFVTSPPTASAAVCVEVPHVPGAAESTHSVFETKSVEK